MLWVRVRAGECALAAKRQFDIWDQAGGPLWGRLISRILDSHFACNAPQRPSALLPPTAPKVLTPSQNQDEAMVLQSPPTGPLTLPRGRTRVLILYHVWNHSSRQLKDQIDIRCKTNV